MVATNADAVTGTVPGRLASDPSFDWYEFFITLNWPLLSEVGCAAVFNPSNGETDISIRCSWSSAI